MKLGLFSGFNSLLRKYGAKAALDRIKAMGFCAVEPMHNENLYTPEMIKALNDKLKEKEMSVSCYSVCVDLSAGEDQLDILKKAIDNAQALKSPFIHFTLIPSLNEAKSIDEFIDKVANRARYAADLAAERGICALTENQGYVFNGVKNMKRFFEAAHSDNLFYCSDLGNSIFVDEDPLTAVRELINVTKHVHIKDYRYLNASGTNSSLAGRQFCETVPGEGNLPLKECLDVFKDTDIVLSLEYCGDEEGIERTVRNVKNMI